jgi:hypothetical protein
MTLRKTLRTLRRRSRSRPVDVELDPRHSPTRSFAPSPWPHDPAKAWPHDPANWQAACIANRSSRTQPCSLQDWRPCRHVLSRRRSMTGVVSDPIRRRVTTCRRENARLRLVANRRGLRVALLATLLGDGALRRAPRACAVRPPRFRPQDRRRAREHATWRRRPAGAAKAAPACLRAGYAGNGAPCCARSRPPRRCASRPS